MKLHMTKMLAIEWVDHQIPVNTVSPERLEKDSPSRATTGVVTQNIWPPC